MHWRHQLNLREERSKESGGSVDCIEGTCRIVGFQVTYNVIENCVYSRRHVKMTNGVTIVTRP